MKGERRGLGLFKGSRGKELKKHIAEANSRLKNAENVVQYGRDAEKRLSRLYSDLELFEKRE